MNGVESIAAERRRQVDEEGRHPKHDDQYVNGELTSAAVCYLLNRASLAGNAKSFAITLFQYLWPWTRDWWKPKDERRDLVRAGALIAAEIDRLDRLAEKSTG